MSDRYGACPTCGMWTWLGRHACPPEMEWRHDQTHAAGEWGRVRAYDAAGAARKAAEVWDQDDVYLIRSGESVVIEVRVIASGEVTHWEVSGEAVPQYHAQLVDDAMPAEAVPGADDAPGASPGL